jgi:hypothetical protein
MLARRAADEPAFVPVQVVTDGVPTQSGALGSSPTLYRSLVIVSADNKGGGAIAGLDRATGRVVWKQGRPKLPNYTSPIILSVAGGEQLLLTGCDLVTSLDPLTGTSPVHARLPRRNPRFSGSVKLPSTGAG